MRGRGEPTAANTLLPAPVSALGIWPAVGCGGCVRAGRGLLPSDWRWRAAADGAAAGVLAAGAVLPAPQPSLRVGSGIGRRCSVGAGWRGVPGCLLLLLLLCCCAGCCCCTPTVFAASALGPPPEPALRVCDSTAPAVWALGRGVEVNSSLLELLLQLRHLGGCKGRCAADEA